MALLPAPPKDEIAVRHVWRRPRVGGSWECVSGVKGTKMDAVKAAEALEAQASYEDYEFSICLGEDRPPWESRMRRRFG